MEPPSVSPTPADLSALQEVHEDIAYHTATVAIQHPFSGNLTLGVGCGGGKGEIEATTGGGGGGSSSQIKELPLGGKSPGVVGGVGSTRSIVHQFKAPPPVGMQQAGAVAAAPHPFTIITKGGLGSGSGSGSPSAPAIPVKKKAEPRKPNEEQDRKVVSVKLLCLYSTNKPYKYFMRMRMHW